MSSYLAFMMMKQIEDRKYCPVIDGDAWAQRLQWR